MNNTEEWGIFEYGQENLMDKIRSHKFVISHEETSLYLTFISFKIELTHDSQQTTFDSR